MVRYLYVLILVVLVPIQGYGQAPDVFAPLSREQVTEKVALLLKQEPFSAAVTPEVVSETWKGTKVEASVGVDQPVILSFVGEQEGSFFVDVGVSDTGEPAVKVSRVKTVQNASPYETSILSPKIFSIRSGDWGALELLVLGRKYYPQSTQLLLCPNIRKVVQEEGKVAVGLYRSMATPRMINAQFFARGGGKFRSLLSDPSKLIIELIVPDNIPKSREVKDSVIGKDPELTFSYAPINANPEISITQESLATGIGIVVSRILNSVKSHRTTALERVYLAGVDITPEQATMLSLKHVRGPLRCYFYEQKFERTEKYQD
jgi:hypothetical protein